LTIVDNSIFDADANGFVGFAVLVKRDSSGFSLDLVNCGQWRLIHYLGEITLEVGTSPVTTIGSSFSFSANEWHLINIEIDKTGGTMSLRVDNGTLDSTAILGDVLTADMDNTSPVMPAFDEHMDNAWIYDTALDSTERTDLWNNGIPLTYPFTTPQTNITIGDRLVGGTVLDGSSFTTDNQSIPSSATITAFNSVTIYGLTRATNYEDYIAQITNGSVTVDLIANGNTFTNPTYGLGGDYTFVPSGSAWYGVGTDPVPTGSYQSDGALSDFVGEALNTAWVLTVTDNNGGSGDATFTGWSFNVDI
jgi:hypothetical protein